MTRPRNVDRSISSATMPPRGTASHISLMQMAAVVNKRETRPPKKCLGSITFSESPRVHYIDRLDDMPAEDIKNTWFTSDECNDMKNDAYAYVAAIDAGCADVEGRGLEEKTQTGAWNAYKARKDAYNAVLGEMERQQRSRKNPLDWDAIAKLYKMESQRCQEEASSRAKKDEAEALDYLSSVVVEFESTPSLSGTVVSDDETSNKVGKIPSTVKKISSSLHSSTNASSSERTSGTTTKTDPDSDMSSDTDAHDEVVPVPVVRAKKTVKKSTKTDSSKKEKAPSKVKKVSASKDKSSVTAAPEKRIVKPHVSDSSLGDFSHSSHKASPRKSPQSESLPAGKEILVGPLKKKLSISLSPKKSKLSPKKKTKSLESVDRNDISSPLMLARMEKKQDVVEEVKAPKKEKKPMLDADGNIVKLAKKKKIVLEQDDKKEKTDVVEKKKKKLVSASEDKLDSEPVKASKKKISVSSKMDNQDEVEVAKVIKKVKKLSTKGEETAKSIKITSDDKVTLTPRRKSGDKITLTPRRKSGDKVTLTPRRKSCGDTQTRTEKQMTAFPTSTDVNVPPASPRKSIFSIFGDRIKSPARSRNVLTRATIHESSPSRTSIFLKNLTSPSKKAKSCHASHKLCAAPPCTALL